MNVDEVRSEINCMMNNLQIQLDYLDEIFEIEEERQRIEKEQNCFCKFFGSNDVNSLKNSELITTLMLLVEMKMVEHLLYRYQIKKVVI